jgi:hypothetical protein
MRDALREGDYYRGGHGPYENSVGSRSNRAPPPQQSGQLADYYPLIAQAVHRLEHSTAETRQTIYDRARAAMSAQLRIMTPALPESVINREQLALERAIRKVETESLRCAPTQVQPSSWRPNVPNGPIRESGDEQAKRPLRSMTIRPATIRHSPRGSPWTSRTWPPNWTLCRKKSAAIAAARGSFGARGSWFRRRSWVCSYFRLRRPARFERGQTVKRGGDLCL